MDEAVRKDKRRREERLRERTYNTKEMNPAEFTKFMGTYHNQNQQLVTLENFEVDEDMTGDIELCIMR